MLAAVPLGGCRRNNPQQVASAKQTSLWGIIARNFSLGARDVKTTGRLHLRFYAAGAHYAPAAQGFEQREGSRRAKQKAKPSASRKERNSHSD
jgi:hypothetical protein